MTFVFASFNFCKNSLNINFAISQKVSQHTYQLKIILN